MSAGGLKSGSRLARRARSVDRARRDGPGLPRGAPRPGTDSGAALKTVDAQAGGLGGVHEPVPTRSPHDAHSGAPGHCHRLRRRGSRRAPVSGDAPGRDRATLKHRIADGGGSTEQTIAILGRLAAALDYAHARGVIHRDIKPASILLDDDLRTVLADFGIAKVLDDTCTTLSRQYLGISTYMAPEQSTGGPIGHRTRPVFLRMCSVRDAHRHRPLP